MIEDLGLFPDFKNFRLQRPGYLLGRSHGLPVSFHGEWDSFQSRPGAGHKGHHGMERSCIGADALQRRQDVTTERATGVQNNLALPAGLSREQLGRLRQSVVRVAAPDDLRARSYL